MHAQVTLQLRQPDSATPPGVCFQLHAGESVLVMGPSGCGKTALLKAIRGLWRLCGDSTATAAAIAAAGVDSTTTGALPYTL